MPRTKSDILIEALCNQSREEMVKEAKEQVDYCQSKLDYLRRFNRYYRIKGSFGVAYSMLNSKN